MPPDRLPETKMPQHSRNAQPGQGGVAASSGVSRSAAYHADLVCSQSGKVPKTGNETDLPITFVWDEEPSAALSSYEVLAFGTLTM